MNQVINAPEYIIEPATKMEDVMSFFSTVHWSMNRVAGLSQCIQAAAANNQYFKVFLKDNVPYIKSLKEARDGQADQE